MFSAMARFLSSVRRPRESAARQIALAPTRVATCPIETSDLDGDLVAAPVLSRADAATHPPGTLYVSRETGRVMRTPRRNSAQMAPDAFAAAFETWLSEMAPDVSTSWDASTFVGLVEWFASEIRVAPVAVDELVGTGRFERDALGNFGAVPSSSATEDVAEAAPMSPTAERMVDLLARSPDALTVKQIAARLGVCSAPVSRAITRHLSNVVTARRQGRNVFVSLRTTVEPMRAAA